MSVLFLPIDEPVSPEVTLDHLDQVSLRSIDTNIAEFGSSIELKGNVFEYNSYVQHQFLEYVECDHYTALASVVPIETESHSTLVIPEGYLVEIDVEESEFYVVRYVGQIFDIHLPPVQRFVPGIDMMHLREVRFEGMVFLVFGEESDLLSFRNPVFDMVFPDEVIEESPREAESGSEYLAKEYLVLRDEETVVKELEPLVRLMFPEFRQVVDLRTCELVHFLGPGGFRIPLLVVVSLVCFPKGIFEGFRIVFFSHPYNLLYRGSRERERF